MQNHFRNERKNQGDFTRSMRVCGKEEKSHNHILKDQILAWIQNNYYDKNLSVNTVGDQFQMNPAYLSRFFKESTGKAFWIALTKSGWKKASKC